jgi:hypothetical protein
LLSFCSLVPVQEALFLLKHPVPLGNLDAGWEESCLNRHWLPGVADVSFEGFDFPGAQSIVWRGYVS